MVERNSCIICFGFLNAADVYGIILCLSVGRRILLRKLWYVIDLFKHILTVLFRFIKSVTLCVCAQMSAPVDCIKHLMSPNEGWKRCFRAVLSGSFLRGELHTFYILYSVTLQSWLQPRIVSKSCKWMQLRYCLSSYIVQRDPYWVERFAGPMRKVRRRLNFIT